MISIFLPLFISYSVIAETNLGTLNTIKNGFGTVNECISELNSDEGCKEGPLNSLKDILNFTTTNQCVATKAEFKEKGIDIPNCPDKTDKISGLDNTHPSVGTFALFTGHNSSFIHDLAKNYLNGSSAGKFNLVLPKKYISELRNNTELIKILNSPRVNIIEIESMPSVGKWMQDSFQFTSLNGKPAIYQLEHGREKGSSLESRLACDLAKKCNIPYYIPPDMVDPLNKEYNSLNSGGNLEVLPGGTFYTGIINTGEFGFNLPDGQTVPYRTNSQKIQKKSLKESGNKLVELDISFLSVGHVDEIVNIVKIDQPAPCDYAVLLASPKKAFELMEKASTKGYGTTFLSPIDLLIGSAYAGMGSSYPNSSSGGESKCKRSSYRALQRAGEQKVLSEENIREVYDSNCINGVSIEDYTASNNFKILKRINVEQSSPVSISTIMEKNKEVLLKELKTSTSCKEPVVIDIPVFFRNGLSYTPDLVNGVVETPPGEASNVYLPKSYFRPFDEYVKNKLSELGVDTSFVHDMGYHLQQGEVHCGSNTARICNQ